MEKGDLAKMVKWKCSSVMILAAQGNGLATEDCKQNRIVHGCGGWRLHLVLRAVMNRSALLLWHRRQMPGL